MIVGEKRHVRCYNQGTAGAVEASQDGTGGGGGRGG